MKSVEKQMAPINGPLRLGPVSLDAMFGHLIADETWMMIDNEVQRYVIDLDETLSGPVYSDLLEEEQSNDDRKSEVRLGLAEKGEG